MSDTPEQPEAKKKKGKGRKPGTPKTGGRAKGTRNRNSLNVLTALDNANLPIVELLVASIECLEPVQQVEKYFQLMAYCYPKLNQIDFQPAAPTGAPQAPVQTPPDKPRNPQERLDRLRGHFTNKSPAPGK